MAQQRGCNYSLIGYAIGAAGMPWGDGLGVAVCPSCMETHAYPTMLDDFDGIEMGLCIDPEDVMEFTCTACIERAEAVCGIQELAELAVEGEIELYDETIREVCQLLDGWDLSLNA